MTSSSDENTQDPDPGFQIPFSITGTQKRLIPGLRQEGAAELWTALTETKEVLKAEELPTAQIEYILMINGL